MIYPVILCGGAGTRLWPLSRKGFPKQFATILGDTSLLQQAVRRVSGDGFAAPTVVASADHRFIVVDQLSATNHKPKLVLVEPEAKNTAPAVLAAAQVIFEEDPEALILILPPDQAIDDDEAFREMVKRGVGAATEGRIVTFGIKPTRAETGYGWLEVDDNASDVMPLKRFIGKPQADLAETMLTDSRYLWNAGIFLSSARSLLEEYELGAPHLVDPVRGAIAAATNDLGFLQLDSKAWSQCESISVDYAIMERCDRLSVVPFASRWNDLGSWDAVAIEMPHDSSGNAASGAVTAIDCSNTLLRSENDGLELVGIGLENLLVVAMKDAVLVADRSKAQDVKSAVERLKSKRSNQAEAFSVDHRPWGHFETLALADRFQVKRIVVKPGAALSLQSHVHRSEHWIVVSGTARVTIDNEMRLVSENESVYIPLGAKHRMENPGKLPMVLIEVQTGAYLGEDDIVRYEDIYARGQGAMG